MTEIEWSHNSVEESNESNIINTPRNTGQIHHRRTPRVVTELSGGERRQVMELAFRREAERRRRAQRTTHWMFRKFSEQNGILICFAFLFLPILELITIDIFITDFSGLDIFIFGILVVFNLYAVVTDL